MTPLQVRNEIQTIIVKLIEAGMSIEQRSPVYRQTGAIRSEIIIDGLPDLSVSMKNLPYDDVYKQLDSGRAFHIKMIDGALIQMCYRFEGNAVLSHRLCMFPAPSLEPYDLAEELYEEDELYADIVGRNIVHVPLRFDFDSDPERHTDVIHPKSHLTLGQYVNCRIPVEAPLSPSRFIKFILRNFYHNAFMSAGCDALGTEFRYPTSITANERAIAHIIC
jgi:hypothetical protein